MSNSKTDVLLGLTLEELTSLCEERGEPPFRARQIFDAVYRQRISSVESISTLPLALRKSLNEDGIGVGCPSIQQKFVSTDGTVRYLIGLSDGQAVETVWMPEGDDGERGDGSDAGDVGARFDRATICVSSQVGCAVGCEFCMTALLGVSRNLTTGEIVGQVCAVLNDHGISPPTDRVNLVFMGMGEPFLNYENFIKAVGLLKNGVGIPESRMTVSTSGIVPRIYDLGTESLRPKLAISLNASNDELRTRLMPINRKWNLEKLIAAAREFPVRPREKLTFEYVLLDQVNDSEVHAREVVELIRGVRAKVNLIALNPGPGIEFQMPQQDRVLHFQKILIDANIPTFIRRPRGRDIYAACGQLKRTVGISRSEGAYPIPLNAGS